MYKIIISCRPLSCDAQDQYLLSYFKFLASTINFSQQEKQRHGNIEETPIHAKWETRSLKAMSEYSVN